MSHVDPETLALLSLGEEAGSEADRAHVRTCPRCSAELATLSRTAEVARGVGPDAEPLVSPPQSVWEAVRAELGLEERRPGRAVRWTMGIAAAVVLAAAVTGGLLLSQAGGAVVASATLAPLDGGGAGNAILVESDGGLAIEVEVSGLVEPSGFYELWLLSEGAERLISLGPVSAEQQTVKLPTGVDVSSFPVVDISREPLDGDPSHSGDSVLRGTLPVEPQTVS